MNLDLGRGSSAEWEAFVQGLSGTALASLTKAMNFNVERLHLQSLYAELLQPKNRSFEERLQVLELHFPLEDLLNERLGASDGSYFYCLYTNEKEVRYARLRSSELEVVRKLKAQVELTREEKQTAVDLLSRL